MAHHVGDASGLFVGHEILGFFQHLRKAHDDVEGRADLVRHVLDEQRLLLAGGFRQFTGMHQFFVTAQGLFVHLPDLVHMVFE